MAEEKALVKREKELHVVPNGVAPMSLDEMLRVGEILAKSGFFADVKSVSQAVAKIIAGHELGFPVMASMTGIHIVKGKVTVGANLQAAAVRRHPDYNYHIVELSDKECTLAFFVRDGDGQFVEEGRSTFTEDDAKRAGLLGGTNWQKYPRNMYFARAMSNGVKWFCPDVFGGAPIYAPDELGAVVDEEGNVVDASYEVQDSIPLDVNPGGVLVNLKKAREQYANENGDTPTVAELLANRDAFEYCQWIMMNHDGDIGDAIRRYVLEHEPGVFHSILEHNKGFKMEAMMRDMAEQYADKLNQDGTEPKQEAGPLTSSETISLAQFGHDVEVPVKEKVDTKWAAGLYKLAMSGGGFKKFGHIKHLTNHLKIHFGGGVTSTANLTWEQAVAFRLFVEKGEPTEPWYTQEDVDKVKAEAEQAKEELFDNGNIGDQAAEELLKELA